MTARTGFFWCSKQEVTLSKCKDGGPAFPMAGYTEMVEGKPHTLFAPMPGMSLRDYFAARAMQAEMITSFSDATPKAAKAFLEAAKKAKRTVEGHLAHNSYRIADAMLAEREKANL